MINKKQVMAKISIVLSGILFLGCFAAFPSLAQGYKVSQIFYFHAIGSLVGVFLMFCWLTKAEVRLTAIDLLTFIYLAYIELRILTNPLLSWYSEHTLTTVLLIGVYLFWRLFLCYQNFLITTLIILQILALVQVVLGVLQWIKCLPSWNDAFRVTGSFFNPGPYAGFLISILPICLLCTFSSSSLPNVSARKRDLQILGLATTLSIVVMLPLTGSRAAFIGAIVGSVILLSHRFGLLLRIRLFFSSSRAKMLGTISALTLVGGSAVILFYLRPASVLGRLLNWKICGLLIWDHPLVGVGYDQFFACFGQYQAEYFAKHPNDPLSFFAGQGEYAFNLFLEIAVEQGLVGLSLFILLTTVALRSAMRFKNALAALAGAILVSILSFGLFSYPFSIILIQLNFLFALALLSSQQTPTVRWVWPTIRVRHALSIVSALLLVYLDYHSIERYYAHKNWKVASYHKDFFNYEKAIPMYDRIFPLLRDNGKFLFEYGQTLSYEGKHRKAVVVLEKARQRTTDTYLYLALGDSYRELKEYDKAERMYKFAINHNPYRFYPRYVLTQLYRETDRIDEALTLAHKIVSMNIKVNSPQVEDIRREMNTFIDTYSASPKRD